MLDPVIAYVVFVDGSRRPIFERQDSGQYVLDDDGESVDGVWLVPKDAIDVPLAVDG